jgi:hypothetical protein
LSNAIPVFLDMQGIEMLEGDVWGHRKDRIGSELIKYYSSIFQFKWLSTLDRKLQISITII